MARSGYDTSHTAAAAASARQAGDRTPRAAGSPVRTPRARMPSGGGYVGDGVVALTPRVRAVPRVGRAAQPRAVDGEVKAVTHVRFFLFSLSLACLLLCSRE